MQINHYSFLISLFLLCQAIVAQGQVLSKLNSAVDILDRDPAMQSANWGITVINTRTGDILLSHNGNKSLATASTMKIVSTATALATLGANYRFETAIEYSGTISEDGILQGNLYIRGSGDPTLGSSRFGEKDGFQALLDTWISVIQSKGIRQINGDIIGDASYYGSQLTPPKWPWEDMGNYYGAGPGGLNIHENFYRLDLKPGTRQGMTTEVAGTYPPQTSITFFNEILTGKSGSGDNGYIYGSPYTHTRYLRGTIPPGKPIFSIKGSIPDPALYTAESLASALLEAGIDVTGRPSTLRLGASAVRNCTGLSLQESPPLHQIVYQTNQYSINLYAEALALASSVTLGRAGNTAAAVDAMKTYWKGQGIATQGMYLRDGSGLSPNNVLSTNQLASILSKASQTSWFPHLDASLPVAGRSGSLKRMMKGTAAEGRLRAKSGYISGVRGYAGYVDSPSGDLLAFAMIANYYSCSASQMRKKFSTLMIQLAEGQ